MTTRLHTPDPTNGRAGVHYFQKSHGSFNIARWSIEHPFAIIAFYLGVVILAIVAISGALPRRMMPYVESPMVGVVTMMPGLSAQEMETYVSMPIEEQMVNIEGVRYIRSTSQDGFSMVSLEFPYGTDMAKATFDVQAIMNVAQANLPATSANLKPSWVLPIDPLNLPVLSLSLTGKGWDPVRLRELADNQITDRLKTVRDVQSIQVFGGRERQLQVVVDRAKLAAYGLSIIDVKNAIDRNNVSRSGGTLTAGGGESIVRVPGAAMTAEDVAGYPLTSVNGQVVYIRDVARVLDTFREQRSGFHYVHAGKITSSIEVSVIQNPAASSPQVIAAVKAELQLLKRDYPGIDFQVAYDNSHFVSILMTNMGEELGTAIVLTGIMVLLFLGEWRGTLISLTTIPVSLGMAVLLFYPVGLNLNSSTLIGMLLSIGRLVDDSIIDIHAVQRHLRMGKDAKTATVDGITEVRLAVMASTFMLCLALSPLLFSGGIVQQMFVGLVWPIIFGLLASLVVSFTLTSLMCAYLLRSHAELAAEREGWMYRRVLGPVQHGLDRLDAAYKRGVAFALRNRFLIIALALGTIVVGFTFYQFIGSEMMPLADVGQAYGVLEAAPGTSYADTEKKVRQFEGILAAYPEIEKVATQIGFEPGGTYFNGYNMGSVDAAMFMITLKDKDQRRKTIWDVIDSAQRKGMETIPGVRRITIKEMGSDVMASSEAPISLLIYGKDLAKLYQAGLGVLHIGEQTKGLYQPYLDWSMTQPSYEIHIDRARAAEMGLSEQNVADQAYAALRGTLTNEYWHLPNIRQLTILVRYSQRYRSTPEDIRHITITGKNGEEVPLNSLASVSLEREPTFIDHDSGRRVIYFNGFYRQGSKPSMDLSMEIMGKAMMGMRWPPGYGVEMRGDMTQMMDSFNRMYRSLALAVLFIFLVLVAQFRGLLQPFQMMLSLPLELSGVFIMLYLNHQNFSTVSLLGVVILTGMDITAAILMIDMIMQYRAAGMPRNEAVIEAAPERLRPILMTAIISIIVMVPVAFWPKTGIDAYSSLGSVIIGGLSVGTGLTLFVIPVLHTIVDDLEVFVTQKLFKKRPAPGAAMIGGVPAGDLQPYMEDGGASGNPPDDERSDDDRSDGAARGTD